MLRRFVQVKTQVELMHCWPEAPEEVGFLRNPHRHMLFISAKVSVEHNDREIEFIMVKRALDAKLKDIIFQAPLRISCEDIAEQIILWLSKTYGKRAYTVEVFEDNENGAILEHEEG